MKSQFCTARSFFINIVKSPTRGQDDGMILRKCSAGYRKRESCNEVQFVINHEPLCAVHLSDEKSNQIVIGFRTCKFHILTSLLRHQSKCVPIT